jgi:hypothetical protein
VSGNPDENAAAQPMIDWMENAPPAELAVELMAAFGHDGARAYFTDNLVRRPLSVSTLSRWLRRGYYANRSSYKIPVVLSLDQPLAEAIQLLALSAMVRQAWNEPGQDSWTETLFGLAVLANGKAAVWQRIKDRTGL